MRIRDEQMKAFSEAVVQDFRDRIAVHLHRFFPEHTAVASGNKLQDK